MKTFQRFTEDRKRLEANGEIGELMTDNAVNDAQRMSDRLIQLRRGLRQLLVLDDELDDEWLRRFGLTRWDTPTTTEAADPAQTTARQEVATAKRQELTAKQRVLKAKQADLAVKQRTVQRDIAKMGGTR
jgi:hypothetical protein